MNKMKEKVVSLLNMNLNPTVIGFQDDGLFYLFDALLQGKQPSNGYDPTFTFVHLTINSTTVISDDSIEEELNKVLQLDAFPGDTIMETILNDVEVVCVVDNLAFVEDPSKFILISDNLIKKYRDRLKFVYVIEDPRLIESMKGKLPASSAIFDAIIYQEIGNYWDADSIYNYLKPDFKKELSEEQLNSISAKSGNHFGTFKRLYKDTVLEMDTTERYIQLLTENFSTVELNALRKVARQEDLNSDETLALQPYVAVSLVNEGITIPLLAEQIKKATVPNKVFINEANKLSGLDLNLLSKAERDITEGLIRSGNIITKEAMGDIIWKDEASLKFSVWAVDQRIARLRRKFMDLGFDFDIQTIYGKGYKLVKIGE